ncbi:MAG: hypothetical protein KatS3mg111_1039 [Pirellulaceae bacterium]|nr:MAG: hypothetical protein KatS3mg111_1039 [Pirellulaceae bacterium]
MAFLRIGLLVILYGIGMSVAWAVQPPAFRVHSVNPHSAFSAATAFDVNHDGRLDIVCGAYWYAAPDWTPHRFREIELIRGRFDDYSNLPLDVDRDGDLDLISVNYRSSSLYWSRNPGPSQAGVIWDKILIDRPGHSETGRLVDIDGDGMLDVLPNGTDFAAWYEVVPDADAPTGVRWRRHPLPEALAGHGIGYGDLNGDGRLDIIGPQGWAEGPEDPRHQRWVFHGDFRLAGDCGISILCRDVDGDGDQDLIWGRGHHVGLYWSEQLPAGASSVVWQIAAEDKDSDLGEYARRMIDSGPWCHHAIDTRWSNAHTVMQADIDGDGTEDLVAGKRFQGHGGRDPGENDPLSVWWYRFDTHSRTWHDHCISKGGTCGIDLDSICVDLDADGDIDILAPAICGLHWLENLREGEQTIEETTTAVEPLDRILAHRDPYRLDVWYDSSGQPHELENWLQHGVRRQQILRQIELVMGPLPGSSRRAALDVIIDSIDDAGSYLRIHLTYGPEPGDRVPALLLLPKGITEPAAAMLCLHPTHFQLGKAQVCGLGGNPTRFYAHELAQRGFVCLAPDYPGFAEYPYDFEADDYPSGSMKAVWNNVRAIDLLQSLPSVDPNRIGVIGHSLGGHNALFTAAMDQRIRAVVTSCGFTSFANYYDGDLTGWTSQRYMPSIASVYGKDPRRMPFDFPEVLAAIAPRPIFVNAPLHDDNFDVDGVRRCQQALAAMYAALKAESPARFVYPDAGHDFPDSIRQSAYAWLEQHLAP